MALSQARSRKYPKSSTSATPLRCASFCSHKMTPYTGPADRNSPMMGEGSSRALAYTAAATQAKSDATLATVSVTSLGISRHHRATVGKVVVVCIYPELGAWRQLRVAPQFAAHVRTAHRLSVSRPPRGAGETGRTGFARVLPTPPGGRYRMPASRSTGFPDSRIPDSRIPGLGIRD